MSPVPDQEYNGFHQAATRTVAKEITKPTDPNGLVLEAWAQGRVIPKALEGTVTDSARLHGRSAHHYELHNLGQHAQRRPTPQTYLARGILSSRILLSRKLTMDSW
jgi:hypothetical protein